MTIKVDSTKMLTWNSGVDGVVNVKKYFMLKLIRTFLFAAKKSDRAARALRLRKRRDGGGGEDSSKVLKVN